MKKQILFFAFVALAFVFAGINKSSGQEASPVPAVGATAPTCITPTPLDATLCTGNPLTPYVGVPYTYEVTVPTPTGTKSYNWFVTTDQTFISTTASPAFVSSVVATVENGTGTGSHILAAGTIPAASTGYGPYNTPATGTSKIEIAWKYWVHDPTAPVFLVVYVKNDATCDNDNIQVYIIKPVHSFTLDIAPIQADGTPGAKNATVDGPCASPISSAIFVVPDATHPDGQIEVEHGVNYLYYMVTAANFNKGWLPKFQVSGTGIDGTTYNRVITAIDWQYAATSNVAGAWNATTAPTWDATNSLYASSGAVSGGDVPVMAADGVFGGSTGECIVVRVTVANHRIETLAAEPITLAVDGIMYDETAASSAAYYTKAVLGDIHHTSGAGAGETCPWTDLFVNDKATVNIMPRPQVDDSTLPATNDFIPKKLN